MADDIPTRPELAQEVLFLSPFFAPEPISTGKYNAYLARGLVASGLRVRAICSHPLYPDWVVKPTGHQEPGMHIERGGKGLRYPSSNIGRRLILEAWYAWHVCRALLRTRSPSQTVVAVFPPVLFALPALALLRKRRMIGIVHDLYGIMATSADSWSRRLVARLVGTIERAALRRCERLVALSTSMKEVLTERYGIAAERITVSYPFETLSELPRSEDELAAILPADAINVVYSGALGEKQMPVLLREVFERLVRADPRVICHIFSAGPAFDQLRQQEETSDSRLRLHPLVDEQHLWELYARCSLQVVPQAPGTGAGAFPSKLPNLVAAGVPVFAMCDTDSELAQVLREAEAGDVAPGTDAEELCRALQASIERLCAQTHEQRRTRTASYVERHFRVSGLLGRLAVKPTRPSTER